MKLSKSAAMLAFGVSMIGAVLVVACGGDDDGGTTPSQDAGTDTGSSSADTGSTFVDTGTDAGDGGATGLANGATCTTASDTSTECASGVCRTQGNGMGTGTGGAKPGTFCVIKCDTANTTTDPKCAVAPFDGKCNGKLYCEIAP